MIHQGEERDSGTGFWTKLHVLTPPCLWRTLARVETNASTGRVPLLPTVGELEAWTSCPCEEGSSCFIASDTLHQSVCHIQCSLICYKFGQPFPQRRCAHQLPKSIGFDDILSP